jgi:hypothetical protein
VLQYLGAQREILIESPAAAALQQFMPAPKASESSRVVKSPMTGTLVEVMAMGRAWRKACVLRVHARGVHGWSTRAHTPACATRARARATINTHTRVHLHARCLLPIATHARQRARRCW